MQILFNGKARELAPGTRLADLARETEEKVKGDPMIAAMIQKTGSSQLLFILNGRVVKAGQLERVELREGDDLRYVHPYFGG